LLAPRASTFAPSRNAHDCGFPAREAIMRRFPDRSAPFGLAPAESSIRCHTFAPFWAASRQRDAEIGGGIPVRRHESGHRRDRDHLLTADAAASRIGFTCAATATA
jgi:hypothetical protein